MRRAPILLGPVAVVVAVLLGCRSPVAEAPEELRDLGRYLYRSWDDPAAAEDGLRVVEAFLDANVRPDMAWIDRSWTDIDRLTPDDVPHDRPTRPMRNLLGSAIAYASAFPLADHAPLQTCPDQTKLEPTAIDYLRRFPDEPAPSCFHDASCPDLFTANDITRNQGVMELSFEQFKHFRHFDYTLDDGTPRRAFYARSWFEQSFPGDGGALHQSYTVDLWIARDGGTWRMQFNWTEQTFDALDFSDDQLTFAMGLGIDRTFRQTEALLEDGGG